MFPPRMTRARAGALLFGGLAIGANGSLGRTQTTTQLHIGVQPVENAMESYYAKDMGFFTSAGLDVDIQIIQTTSAITAAVASGALDIGYGTVDVLATIFQKNIPLVVIAPASEFTAPATEKISGLVVPIDSTVHSAKDLSGKTIATAGLHSLSETTASAWIDQNGGDSSTVKFVEVPFPAIGAALAANRVDAGYLAEPFLSVAIAQKSGRLLCYPFDAIAKRFTLSAWFTTPQWAKDHADVVARFASVIHDTAVWANKNPEKSGEILAKYGKIDPAIVATMARTHYGEQLAPALMQPIIDASAKYNGFAPFPAQRLLAPR